MDALKLAFYLLDGNETPNGGSHWRDPESTLELKLSDYVLTPR